MLSRHLLSSFILCITLSAQGQLSQGGAPWEWERTTAPDPSISARTLEGAVHMDRADAANGFRYGVQRSLSVDVLASGTWDLLPDGRQRCRLLLRSAGAVMLSVQFDHFRPAAGATVFLYDASRTRFIGGFDASTAVEGGLATAVLPGDAVVIEYLRPAGAVGDRLEVASITHGVVDVFDRSEGARDIDPGYQSAPCQMNVSCPAASDWQAQKRSVALFLRPDGGGCTGTIVNNTANNGVPYFLSAKHCYLPNEGQWVFYFNYDSPTCVGDVGPTTQTLSGAALAAANDGGDLLLVRLNNTPPEAYNVYYAGWDRSTAAPTSGSLVHHPLSDVKKINLFTTQGTSVVHSTGTNCWSVLFNNGLMEGGSSGAPLFNTAKRLVGTAFDATQTCATATTAPVLFAKFNANWDGTSSDRRLRDWLDPANTATFVNGYDPTTTPAPVTGLRVSVRAMLQGAFQQQTGNMRTTLRDLGRLPTTEPYTALGYPHVAGGGSETVAPAVLAVTGSSAIVDWVVLELRPAANPASVVATRAALIRSDGMVVDVDGVSTVNFPTAAWGNYHIGLRHRNHLGVMTARAQVLGGVVQFKNFMNGAVELYGNSQATVLLAGTQCLVAGDVTFNGRLRYIGEANDRDRILTIVGGGVPTQTAEGYRNEDTDLDGLVRYTGTGNDRDIILQNIGGSLPTGTRQQQIPE